MRDGGMGQTLSKSYSVLKQNRGTGGKLLVRLSEGFHVRFKSSLTHYLQRYSSVGQSARLISVLPRVQIFLPLPYIIYLSQVRFLLLPKRAGWHRGYCISQKSESKDIRREKQETSTRFSLETRSMTELWANILLKYKNNKSGKYKTLAYK